MSMKRKLFLAVTAFVAVMGAGCDQPPAETERMPELNAENCKPENIAKIQNEATREQFATTCLRLPGFKPSPARSW